MKLVEPDRKEDIDTIAAAVAAHDCALEKLTVELTELRRIADQTTIRLRLLERKEK